MATLLPEEEGLVFFLDEPFLSSQKLARPSSGTPSTADGAPL